MKALVPREGTSLPSSLVCRSQSGFIILKPTETYPIFFVNERKRIRIRVIALHEIDIRKLTNPKVF